VMGVRMGSKSCGDVIWSCGVLTGHSRSPQQVIERLDKLIAKIRDIQRPHMNGEKPADVVVVAHGMSLRCFVKRWLGYPLDMPLALMLSPGAIGILRYACMYMRCSRGNADDNNSYLKHDIEQPAFFVGMSLPPL
jgi:broad specificity phosphatase PhoE